MRILNFYLVNHNTVGMVPIVAENGRLYTVVFEREHMAVVGKSPSMLIQESKQFYRKPPTGYLLTRKWGSIGNVNDKQVQANFQFTKKYL
ncbi:competence protein ComK [Solibacillus sp. FSL W8-0372]|uniref:competence protein ComK n=1 Tax=Solibacillus sp. FSL W8-0372 TaxID=2921713 RepID=UPI0030CFE5A2